MSQRSGQAWAGQNLPMPYTYIVECADGSYYVGSTYDLERRVSEHNLGIGATYMLRRGRRPVRLVFAADFPVSTMRSPSRNRCRAGTGPSDKP